MSEYSSELLGAQPPASAPPIKSYAKEILGTGEMRAMPDGTKMPAKSSPSVTDTFSGSAPFTSQVASGMSPDVSKQIKILSNTMGIPETSFGVIDGNLVYHDKNSGEIRRVTPSVTGATGPGDAVFRALQWLGSQFGPSLPGVAGTVAGVATAPFGGGVPGAAAAAGATDVVRQGIGNALAGAPITDIDLANAGGQAALGGAGQAGGAIVNRVFQRNPLGVAAFDRAAARDPAAVADAAAVVAEAKKRGVDLSAGQATGLNSLQAQERQLGRFPETQDTMQAFRETQRLKQVPAAIGDELNKLAPNVGGEQAIDKFRQGANAVIQKELKSRSDIAKVAYATALDDRTDRFWTPELENLLSRPSGQKGLAYAKLIAAEEGKDITVPVFENGKLVGRDVVPDWRSWDYIKRGIDSVIAEHTNDLGKVDAVGRATANTRRQMLGFLDKANPEYAAARAAYGGASEGVDTILDGGVGLLQRMKGPERQAMVEGIFGGRALMPEEVGRMRGLFKEADKLPEWNDGVRQFISGKLDNALKAENPAQAFYKSMEQDPAQRRVLRAAIGDTELVASWENLMKVLDHARKGLGEGSPTVTDLPSIMGPQTVGKAARFMGAATSPSTYLNAGNEIVAAVDQLRTPGARIKLANALLDPDAVSELRKLRMFSPTSEKALAITSRVLASVGLGATGLTTPADAAIPDAPAETK